MANKSKSLSFNAKKLKACRGRDLLKDRFSELPDDIKIKVLSLLTMKEAGRTSVLSKRWRYIWAYIPVLNFDDLDTVYKLMLVENALEVEKPRYLRWVNQVVGSYKGPIIDEFRVRFGIDADNCIDNWVNFAMEKRVKRLEMNFDPHINFTQDRCYTFCGLSISNSITSLKLSSVNVDGEVLQKILKLCPSLEYLSVRKTKSLVSLEVSGATLNLKYLEIYRCSEVKYIEICAPNLVSVTYRGPKISTPFKSTPKLNTLSIGGEYCGYLTNNFLEFPSCLLQLEELTLQLPHIIRFYMKSADQFPLCKRLKRLELTVIPLNAFEDICCLAPLIKACPFLHKLVLKVRWSKQGILRRHREIEACRHEHLKMVEIVGFVGNSLEMEFITYLIKSCVALKKIVIDLRMPQDEGTPWELDGVKNNRRARECAEKLRAELEPEVEVLVLEF